MVEVQCIENYYVSILWLKNHAVGDMGRVNKSVETPKREHTSTVFIYISSTREKRAIGIVDHASCLRERDRSSDAGRCTELPRNTRTKIFFNWITYIGNKRTSAEVYSKPKSITSKENIITTFITSKTSFLHVP